MIKTYATLMLSLSWATGASAANPVTVSFNDTPMPSALKTIELLAGDDVTINFAFSKLEDYTVTTDIIDATPLEAISQTIGFYPIKVARSGSVYTVQPKLDTEYKVSGRLVNDKGEGVDYASIALLSAADSVALTGGVSNSRGDFVIPVATDQPMLLRTSRIGYAPVMVPVSTGNNGDIRLEADPRVLKTLTAYGDSRIVSTVGAVTNIRVEGTPYSQIGTLADLLPSLPGLLAPQSSALADGTVYYINGREVSETTQLNMLRTSEIKDIAINKAPGAEYPADATMVVNITTVKSPSDFVHLQLSNTMLARHKLSDTPDVDFKLQLGKFTTALALQYDYLQSQVAQDLYRNTADPQASSWLRSMGGVYGKNKAPRLNWTGELQFNPRNRLGLYYYFYSLDDEKYRSGEMQTMKHGTYSVSSYEHSTSSLHSGTVSYDHTGNRLTLHLAQDVAYTNPYTNANVLERQKGNYTSRFDVSSHEYFVTTTNARLGLNLTPRTLVSLGGRVSYIESNTSKIFMDDPYNSSYLPEGDYGYGGLGKHNFMNVNETTLQGYLTLSQRIGNVLVEPGIRYEHIDRWISDDAQVEKPGGENGQLTESIHNVYDRQFGRWLPSLKLKYTAGSLCTTLNYMSRMTQPTFSMLNSGLVYEDNFTFYKSNSLLEPTTIDELRLTVGYGGLTADIGHKTINHGIAEIEESVGDGSVVYRTPVNLKRYRELDFNLSYASTVGRLGYYAAAQLVVPGWHTVSYSSQKVTFNAQLNLTYRLNRQLSFYTAFKHIGSCRWMVYDRVDSQLWNVGANASLLGGRLNVNLEATDILGRNHTQSITTVYNGATSQRVMGSDTQGVRLRVAYTLFNKPIRTNVRRGNIDAIDRIER